MRYGPVRYAVFYMIYWSHTGIWVVFDSFWAGMVWWYGKVVWGCLIPDASDRRLINHSELKNRSQIAPVEAPVRLSNR